MNEWCLTTRKPDCGSVIWFISYVKNLTWLGMLPPEAESLLSGTLWRNVLSIVRKGRAKPSLGTLGSRRCLRVPARPLSRDPRLPAWHNYSSQSFGTSSILLFRETHESSNQARYCEESVHEESHGIGPAPIVCRTPAASVKATRRFPTLRIDTHPKSLPAWSAPHRARYFSQTL